MRTVDVVIIGSGHQALTAAVYLSRAGLSVEVLERNAEIGGATRSGEVTEPGLVHDLYATNLNNLLSGAVYKDLGADLERMGLRFAKSDKPYANVFPNGTSLRVYGDPDKTARMMRDHSEGDLAGWNELHALFGPFVENLLPIYGERMPSARTLRLGLRAVRRLGLRRVLEYVNLLTNSTRELGDKYFETDEAKVLLACWGMHVDYAPDVSFGAMFPFVEAYADMHNGISIAEGGAGALPRALASLVEESGGRVRTDSAVTKVSTSPEGRAVGVVLESGEQIAARRAVIAGTSPTRLFGDLLAGASVAEADRQRASRFQYGPGTMMIHLALDGPVPWRAHPDLRDFAYVHVGPYVDDLARTYQQALAGILPDQPMLVVGQTSRVDPGRTPDDREILWIQVRALPSVISSDSLGTISARTWAEAKEPMADRIMGLLEGYAPGLGALVRARTVMSPEDLERDNPNLVGGDSVAGSHHLGQNFLFRPWLGASNFRTGVPGLYLVGAAVWPGAGVSGSSGRLLASLLRRSSSGRRGR